MAVSFQGAKLSGEAPEPPLRWRSSQGLGEAAGSGRRRKQCTSEPCFSCDRRSAEWQRIGDESRSAQPRSAREARSPFPVILSREDGRRISRYGEVDGLARAYMATFVRLHARSAGLPTFRHLEILRPSSRLRMTGRIRVGLGKKVGWVAGAARDRIPSAGGTTLKRSVFVASAVV